MNVLQIEAPSRLPDGPRWQAAEAAAPTGARGAPADLDDFAASGGRARGAASPHSGLEAAGEMAAALADFKAQRPEVNVAGVVLHELAGRARRDAATLGPAVGGALLGFAGVYSICGMAGFQRLIAIRASPFNPRGIDHSSDGAPLMAWAFALGIGGALAGGALGYGLGRALARLRAPPAHPTTPLGDALVGDLGRLLGAHRGSTAAWAAVGAALFVVPQAVLSHIAYLDFHLNRPRLLPGTDRPTVNFDDRDRSLGAGLLGWALSASVLALTLGIWAGRRLCRGAAALGRAARRAEAA